MVEMVKEPNWNECAFSLNAGQKNTLLHITRTGQAMTLLNLSFYESETVFRCFNDVFTRFETQKQGTQVFLPLW